MFDIKDILEPLTIDEVLKNLEENSDLKIIAGGTDVLIKLHHREIDEVQLLSLQKVDGLNHILIDENENIRIGAMCTFSQIFRNPIINKYIPVLAEAAVSMGGPQVRNMATVGGNICNGAVSADSAPTLFALNAKLVIKSFEQERVVPITDFYQGPGKVKLNQGEILIDIIIEKENYLNCYGEYIKYSNRKAMDIAMLGVCVVGNISENKFQDIRIALGVAAPTPIRCLEAEEYGKGLEVNEENIATISQLTLKSSRARDSWRASKDYREHLIEELTNRAIIEVIKKSGGEI